MSAEKKSFVILDQTPLINLLKKS